MFSRTFELVESTDLGDVVLTAPETVWIRILNGLTGRPVAGARVHAGGGAWKTVDENGTVDFLRLEGAVILVEAEGYDLAQQELPRGVGRTADRPFAIRLAPVFTVEGTYVAAEGSTPAAGGRVTARTEVEGGTGSTFGEMASDGAFSIELDAGAWELELSAGNAGVLRVEVSGSAGEKRDLGVLVAPASAWVHGFVVNPEYAPLFGAEVSYTRPSEFGPLFASELGLIDSVETDREGRFELFGLDPGVSTLRVEAEGFAPFEFEVEAAGLDGINAGTIALSRGRRVNVRSDVGQGQVVIDSGGLGHPRDQLTAELSDRRATIEAVPEGGFRLTVLADGVPVCGRDEHSETGGVSIRCDRETKRVLGRVTLGERPGGGMLLWKSRSRRRRCPRASSGRSLAA